MQPHHVRASPPALLPHSVAPGAGRAQPGASLSPVRGWLAEGALHTPGPRSHLQRPGAWVWERPKTWMIQEGRTVLPGGWGPREGLSAEPCCQWTGRPGEADHQ